MDKEKEKLIEINEYYHDQLEKALHIMYALQEIEVKRRIRLPKHLAQDIKDFEEQFTFRYPDRE